ncbi:MAG: dolichol kinase [Ignavibacteriales bacterium]|nr:dolichol kinase [Ignavibacteriales bacterium]
MIKRNNNINYSHELLRKGIHLCSISIPIFYYFFDRQLVLTIIIPLTVFSLIIDFGRYLIPTLSKNFHKLFGFMLREHEINEKWKTLSGASYVLISASATILIFPKIIAITAFSILIIGDISAALIGIKFGRHKFFNKSLEGTLAFFFVSCIVVLILPKIQDNIWEYIFGFFVAAIAALVENVSYGWADDNLTVPLLSGFALWILYSVFFPDLQLVLPNVPDYSFY